jgi:hypothetical protein
MRIADPVPAAPAASTPQHPALTADHPPAAASTAGGMPITLLSASTPEATAPSLAAAISTDAGRQLARCFSMWGRFSEALSANAVRALARNEPVDPNLTSTWVGRRAHAEAVLRRHGLSKTNAYALADAALDQLIADQADSDRAAGLDWRKLTVPAADLDARLRSARGNLGVDLDHPDSWSEPKAKRAALARRAGIDPVRASQISRWAVEHVDEFDPDQLSGWEVGSETWRSLAWAHVTIPEQIEHPVGVYLTPDFRQDGAWRLGPVLSLETIALIDSLGGRIDETLDSAELPSEGVEEFLAGVNHRTLYAGERQLGRSQTEIAESLKGVLGRSLTPGVPRGRLERWGALRLSRRSSGWLAVEALTFTVKGFPTRRVGSRRSSRRDSYSLSAAMDLGEAVEVAIEREIPLLLSTEASGQLKGRTRVGRMKGRPGLLTITKSDGLSATTRRVVADQAVPILRALQAAEEQVVLDSGAHQLVRMTVVAPLDDDPILKDPQRRIAAVKVVGSGLDMSQTATGKTITTGRAIYHRAARNPGFRALIIASPRLLRQWREELTRGAPGHGLPPLAPNCDVLILSEGTPVASQIRRFHRDTGERGGVVLCSHGQMERFASELGVIHWPLGVVDEIHRYRNPATEGHRALAALRFDSIADFWGLTGTPSGKDAANIDRLVGLCIADHTLLEERLNTAEAGDLLDEFNAARLRLNYGPHAMRVTKMEMSHYLPDLLEAEPLAIEADPALDGLLKALREGGREAYLRLLEVLHELKSIEKHTALHTEAMKEYARVQGMVLGHVDRFVDASVDPQTLTHSKSLLAQALVRDGLVAEACRGGTEGLPLLRGIVAETLAERAVEEQMLVFAERVRCLRQLAETIRDRHGVEAQVADGSCTKDEFDTLKQRFTNGEFPILCLSRVGHEGHNLQVASGMVHLDIPPVPDGLEQRVGRAERIGCPHAAIWTSIPYIIGGGTEHMVRIVAPRGGINHQILDAPEGVDAQDSTIAKQLGLITSQVADTSEQEGYLGTAARLRVAAHIFGVHDNAAKNTP